METAIGVPDFVFLANGVNGYGQICMSVDNQKLLRCFLGEIWPPMLVTPGVDFTGATVMLKGGSKGVGIPARRLPPG